MKQAIAYIPLIFVLLLIGCNNQENNRANIARLVKEWQGKEVVFPQAITFTTYGRDTTDFRIPQSEYKVVIYVDPLGCISCKLQLPKWKELIAYTHTLTDKSIPFLFFFHTQDDKEIRYLLELDQFDLPVCIDTGDELNKLNQFPSDRSFHTFLLDKNNNVLVIGNPIHNLAVKELYLKQLLPQDQTPANEITTIATVGQSAIKLGAIHLGETKTAIFSIKNSGDKPLVIKEVGTTCGCATTSFDKQPAQQGESLSITVKMTPNEKGFFSETITVKCNTKQFIRLSITGTAH